MASPKVEVRFPPQLLAAAESSAAKQGVGLADYIRSLVERDTGTTVQVKRGFQAFSKTALKSAHRAARKSRRRKSAEKA